MPSKQRSERVASFKTMCSETGSPMEFLQKRSDMVMMYLTGQSGSTVLYFLQLGYLFRGNASQKRTAVVNSREDA